MHLKINNILESRKFIIIFIDLVKTDTAEIAPSVHRVPRSHPGHIGQWIELVKTRRMKVQINMNNPSAVTEYIK